MSINSRSKGKRGELEIAALLRDHGIPARRGVQHQGGPGSPDVKHALDAIVHFEVKMVSRLELEDWYDQASVDSVYRVPVVLHRVSTRKLSTPWRATLSAAHLAMLYGYEHWAGLEHGDARQIVEGVANLPVLPHVVQVNALKFEKEMATAVSAAASPYGPSPYQPPVLVHARKDHDALWMASMDLKEFLAFALLPYAKRVYGFEPRVVDEYTIEVEREYEAFWQRNRMKLADNLPLFKAVA